MGTETRKTAVLTLDLQKGIFDFAAKSESVVPHAVKVVEFARKQSWLVIHVGLGFEKGYPEIADHISFARFKQGNLFVKGTPSAEFHNSLLDPKDSIVYKQRVGAFSENQLHLILRSQGIENLILMGVSTSGIVLSTLRRAFDLDFSCTVISNACFDRDPEVHRVLTEKVFTSQATVTTADAFISAH